MTRNQSSPPMNLDLDAFLDSHSTSDDDDVNHHPHSLPFRTVDEILLNHSDSDSDSDSPTPPSSLNRSYLHRADSIAVSSPKPLLLSNEDTSVHSSDSLELSQVLITDDDRPKDPKSTPLNPIKSNSGGELSGGSLALGRSPLFGGVRSSAKPGAALAAAAAASRSIPTPHAAAIKLRRASTATLPKVLNTDELDSSKGSTSCEVVESGTDSEISQSDIKLLEEDVRWVNLQAPQVQVKGDILAGDEIRENSSQADEFCSCEEMEAEGDIGSEVNKIGHGDLRDFVSSSNAELEGTSLITTKNNQKFDDHTETIFPIEGSDKHVSEIHDLSYTLNTTTEFNGNELGVLPASDTNRLVEDLAPAVKQSHDSDNLKLLQKDWYFDHAGDDTGAQPIVTNDVEDSVLQWETGGRRAEKKSHSSMKPLELAEELEKKLAFTGLNWEEGAAAQPMRLEGVRRGSTVLGYFDISMDNTITRTLSSQAFRRDHGFPQAVAVHLNFIAVGMSRGVIVVFPSKYSPHHADNMDSKMLILGLQGDRSYSPVTSMCFNQQGDLLFAGYHDGHFTVWDVQRVSAVKSITEHKAPLVHMLYLGQDSQVTRQFNVVSGDSNGLVKLFRFSVFSWLSRLSTSRTSTLLDESRRTVLCASSLLSDDFFGGPPLSSQASGTVTSSSIGSMMGGVVGGEWKSSEGSSSAEEGVVILVTHQSALVAKVISPTPEVYAQLPKPDGVREGSIPYTAWKFVGRSQESVLVKDSEKVPLLAMAWDQKVQVAKLLKSEKSEKMELKIYGKWTLESSAIGVAWLDDQMLVILTSSGQLYLYAKDGTVIHQTSFAVDGPQVDDLIGYHTHFTNTYENPEKAYHNFVAVRGATVYILGPTHLVVSRLLPWKERIEVLRKAGDWMGALNMAMSLYDGQANGVIDLPRTLDDVQKAIMPYLVELLLSYVDEVFSYMSVACGNQIGKLEELDDSKSESSAVHMEIKDQFTRVGGVAVEFCVHIKRTDILFDEILSRFVSVQHKETFLELLEPYILKDMLGSLPPEIMQVLVEHYSTKGWLQRVEQCVLHMDISSLDFNQVVRLCREHRLYGALIYLFNKGLDDFRAPLEELLAVRNSHSETAAALGYRMLVYLKYCFSGLSFPPGHGTLPPQRLPSLRMELIQFLLEDCNAPSSWAVATKTYKNLYHLLELDTEATLDVLRCALVEEELPQIDYYVRDSTNLILEPMNGSDSVAGSNNLGQRIVDVLALILEAARSSCTVDAFSTSIWPSKDDLGCIIEFIANYVASEKAEVSKELLQQMLEYLTTEVDLLSSASRQKTVYSRRREKMVLALLEVVPETDWDGTHLLHLCEKAQFYQVCGFIHGIRHQYLAALESYMKDVDEPIHTFSFIYDLLRLPSDSDSFQAAIISRVPDLVQLNREGTFFLVADRFSQESQQIFVELRSYPQSLFLYLKTVTEAHSTGTLDFTCLTKGDTLDIPGRRSVMKRSDRTQAFLERISLFPKLMRDNPVQVTDEMTEMYLELLCQYERNSVLPFLETCESYRVEHCLRVCQEHGIIDAAAFLWERVGDVGSALLLTLSDLNDRFIALDATIQSVLENAGEEHFNAVSKKEVKDILDIVHACVGLCQRNSSRLDPDESESLWFQLLDSFCEPLIDTYNDNVVSEGEIRPAESLGRQEEGEACKSKWKVRKSHKGAYIFRKLFSMFIKEIVEGMIGYVRLPTIMLKLLSDNGSQEFGDFRGTILGMLGTYDFERRILDTAKSLIEDDTYYTMSLLKKGASHGYGPLSLQCCVCNCPFAKGSLSSSIRVFSCGHATHLHCELQEKDTKHGGYSAGCPICMPKKKAHKSKSKSDFEGNGLVSNQHPKGKLSQGVVALHPYENDATDGSRQMSRFEILNSLQKEKRMIQVENMPQLRLAPPTVYHEKVKKGADMLRGESSSGTGKIEKTNKIRDVKVKGSSSIRFPMKTTIFGKEKTSKR